VRPPVFTRSLWQVTQYLLTIDWYSADDVGADADARV
jgi:hypothetical protein